MGGLVSGMVKELMTSDWKPSSLGYKFSVERAPGVITTVGNRLRSDFTAMDASRQLYFINHQHKRYDLKKGYSKE